MDIPLKTKKKTGL